MDNNLFLIHDDDYINHIDDKVEMYDLLLTMARKVREQLAAGNTAAAMRVLSKYEQEAREAFSEWGIPDSYIDSGDEDELYELLSSELLIPGSGDLTGVGQFEARHSQPDYPAFDGEDEDGCETYPDEDGDEGGTASELLEIASELTGSASRVLNICSKLIREEYAALEDECAD